MTGRRTHHAHSQYAGEGLNANPSLSGTGSAVDSAPAMDHLPELDLSSPLGLQEMQPRSPGSIPPMQDFPFSSYQDSDFDSSSTLPGYQLSSHSHPAFNPFPDHLQSSGVLGGADQTGPWNPLPASGTPQELPIHTKPGGPSAVRTPMRGSEVSTIPPDSGYRSSSQYETQSHLSTSELNQPGEMDPFMMNQQQNYPDLASPFQEHEQGGSQSIEINPLHPQETIQEQQTEQNTRPDLICSNCGHESKTPSDAKKHMMRHTKPHKCKHPGCSRQVEGFSTRNDLVRHTSSVHGTGGSKIWFCMAPGCQKPDKSWPRLDNFKQHLIRMHPECDVDELVRLAEQRPEFSTGDNENQAVINNVLHEQEYNIRQAEELRQAEHREAEQRQREQRPGRRRASAASTFTSTDSRPKRQRPAEDFPDMSPDPRRVRPNVPTLNTAATLNSIPRQNQSFLSPHSPNMAPNNNALFGRHVTTNSQMRRQRPPMPQLQSDPQQLMAQRMSRSVSQQEPSSRRHTVGNGHQAMEAWQQYNPMVSNFSATQLLHLSPEDTRSAYDEQWNPQAQFTVQHYPHTVAGDANWDLLQNDPMFAYPSYSAAELPPTDDLLGDLARAPHPSSQQASLSPTITSNNPRTPSSSTPTVTPTVMMALDSQTPQDDIADISKLLKGLGDYKHLSKAVGNNPYAQQELSKLLKDPSRSTVKSESNYAQTPSREPTKVQHQRQISSGSDATHSAVDSSPIAPQQAIKSVTQAAAKRTAANKPNATCLECGKEVGRESDLKKHMKRHTKPYGCVWDGCGKAFGSKNDWKRHEATHGEAEGGWRCDGRHAGGCQTWFALDSRPYEAVEQQYGLHLVASGVAAEMMGRYFIPKAHKGAFWCGFCDSVVQLTGEEGAWTEERISHIDRHFMKEEPARHHSQWKECNGNGATKQELLIVASPATGDRGGAAEP